MKNGRIPTWGVVLMLAGSVIGAWLLGFELWRRYKKRWPW